MVPAFTQFVNRAQPLFQVAHQQPRQDPHAILEPHLVLLRVIERSVNADGGVLQPFDGAIRAASNGAATAPSTHTE